MCALLSTTVHLGQFDICVKPDDRVKCDVSDGVVCFINHCRSYR